MKTATLFLALLVMAMPTTCEAQLKHVGLKGALTSSNISYQFGSGSDLETKRRVGFGIAAWAEWFEHSPVTVVTQVEYVQKGMGMEMVFTDQNNNVYKQETFRSRLDYLSISILGKASFPVGSSSIYAMAGPRVDYLLGYADELGFGILFDRFTKALVGGTVGAGVELNGLLAVPIVLEGRYNLDFTKSYEFGSVKVRNNSFDIWLGVSLL